MFRRNLNRNGLQQVFDFQGQATKGAAKQGYRFYKDDITRVFDFEGQATKGAAKTRVWADAMFGNYDLPSAFFRDLLLSVCWTLHFGLV